MTNYVSGQVLTAAELNASFAATQPFPLVTPAPGDNSTAAATTAFVQSSIAAAETAIFSGNNVFTGTNTFPTQAPGTNNTTAASTAFVQNAVSGASGDPFTNVKSFGATGNGTTDDSAAITSACSAVATAGGGTLFFPPGNYLMSTNTFIPPSNCLVQGSGIDATTITNTSTSGGKDCVLTVLMTMTGGTNASTWTSTNTTYAINAPTLGASTVTTTTAANAGNFSAGNIIMISGDTHGSAFWFPSWYTTVVSANAGTGVITLAETLPLGGSQLTTVQKILSLPKDITVRDMTLTVNSNIGGVAGAIMEILGCDTFLIENCKFINANPSVPGAGVALGAPTRNSGFRNCHVYQGAGPIELFGAAQSFIEGCTAFQSSLLIDGGSFDCTVINNHIKEPQENAAAFHAIHCPDYTARIKCIGNSITGLSGTFAGINHTDQPDAQRNHVDMGNTIVGASGSTTGINMSKGVCVGNMFSNLSNGIVLENINDGIIEGNYYDTVTTPLSTFSGTGIFRTRQNPTQQSIAQGATTPTVQGGGSYIVGNSSTTTITGLTGGVAGDEVTIVFLFNTNTSLTSSGSFVLKSGANYANVPQNTVMRFLCTSASNWIEISRTQ